MSLGAVTCGTLDKAQAAAQDLYSATAYAGFDAAKQGAPNYFYCDGTADNVQIQAAIDYVNVLGGGSVLLEEGTYDIQVVLTFYDNISLYGVNMNETVLQANGNISILQIHGVATDNRIYYVNVENVFLDGTTSTGAPIVSIRYASYVSFTNVNITDTADDGLYIFEGWDLNFYNVMITECGLAATPRFGTRILPGATDNSNSIDFIGCRWESNYGGHIQIEDGSRQIHFTDCKIHAQTGIGDRPNDHSIHLVNCAHDITFSSCQILYSADAFHLMLIEGCQDVKVLGCLLFQGGRHGIQFSGSTDCRVEDSTIMECRRVGITTASSSDRTIIDGCHLFDNGQEALNTYNAIYLGDSSYCHISDNIVYDSENYGSKNQKRALEEAGNSNYNTIMDNDFRLNQTGSMILIGSNTRAFGNAVDGVNLISSGVIIPSKPFQFIKELNGTYLTTSPTGIEIDANTEGAILQGHIPMDAHQVVRIRVFAVALDAPIGAGGQMHLELTFNSGAPNAAYNTAATSWTLANHDGEEADYVANDVVTWLVEDGDIGNEFRALAAGNWFDLIVTHEAGSDPDGATDAVFGSISLEYV